MAYGNEVVFGFSHDQYAFVANELGIYLPQTDDEWCDEDLIEKVSNSTNKYDTKLENIHESCLNSLKDFVKISKPSQKISRSSLDSIKYNTPSGKREFYIFILELFYDPDEMGEEPENSTFGIALSGRYSPTFLDWESEHGTLYPVRFTNKMQNMIDIAKEKIIESFPCFEQAHICVVERHY